MLRLLCYLAYFDCQRDVIELPNCMKIGFFPDEEFLVRAEWTGHEQQQLGNWLWWSFLEVQRCSICKPLRV